MSIKRIDSFQTLESNKQSLEATNRDLLEKLNKKTAELNESIKINNKLLARVRKCLFS